MAELPAGASAVHHRDKITFCHLINRFTSSLPRYLCVIRSHLPLQIQEIMGRGVVYFIFQRPRFCCCLPVRVCVIIMSLLGILLSGMLSVVLWFEVSRACTPPYTLMLFSKRLDN